PAGPSHLVRERPTSPATATAAPASRTSTVRVIRHRRGTFRATDHSGRAWSRDACSPFTVAGGGDVWGVTPAGWLVISISPRVSLLKPRRTRWLAGRASDGPAGARRWRVRLT